MNTHFQELQKRIYYSIISFIIIFTILFVYSNNLYTILATPLLKILPCDGSLIATEITSTFFIPIKLSFMVSVVISMPVFLYNIWIFIAPGLYKQEKKFIISFVIIGSLLFFAGVIFSFYFILPIALKFFINSTPRGVILMTDINSYLEFIITISISCGILFQIPIFTIGLIKLNIVTKKELKKGRSYIIVLSLILGMLLTPPDIFSQILLSIPIYVLFELGIFLSK